MNVFSPQPPPPGRDRRDLGHGRRLRACPAFGVPRLCGEGGVRRGGCLKAELRTAAALAFAVAGLTILANHSSGQNEMAALPPSTLKKLSLEQLMDIEVTSVSRRAEKLSETASAIQVVTGEDIHRSGATSLPEALRLAPNLQVAQVDSRQWAISARGFNTTSADKLLVMIDGRTVYTPLFAGMFWDAQHVLLEDLDRIEVVSGPGGALWGANAVNGVINVISKSAKDTQGGLVTAGGGSLLQDSAAVRYGDQIGSNLFFRVYGQRFDRNSAVRPNGSDGQNAWDTTQGGFRTDWYPSDANTLTVQGDVYSGSIEQVSPGEVTMDGQNLLGRWTRTFSSESDLQVQAYFDRTWRRIPNQFAEDLKTYDLDFQHRFPLGERQSVTWGAGCRLMQDDVRNTPGLAFLPGRRDMQLFSGFVQDEIEIIPRHLSFTLGTKIEHNDYSGVEVQPSGRIAWTPDERQTVWAAASRAVRAPSRIDADLFARTPPPAGSPPGTLPGTLVSDPNFDSEKLIAFELGYRVRPADKLTLSLATFYNEYDQLRSVNGVFPAQIIANDFEGETYGVELSGNWQATDWWRMRGGYTYVQKDLRPTSAAATLSVREGNDPQNQFLLQSIVDLPAHFQFDVVARYVDTLGNPNVPSYFTCDVRVAWRYKDRLEISLVGQNLWDNQHPEFGAAASRQEIPRSIYGKVTWRF